MTLILIIEVKKEKNWQTFNKRIDEFNMYYFFLSIPTTHRSQHGFGGCAYTKANSTSPKTKGHSPQACSNEAFAKGKDKWHNWKCWRATAGRSIAGIGSCCGRCVNFIWPN
jgi:hypothetical protein